MRSINDDWRPFSTLRGLVRLVLLTDWDPIGILGYPGAMDEYDSYANEICRLIQTGATREILIAHLDKIEKSHMGLRGERQAQSAVADKLLNIYKTIQREDRWQAEE